MVGAAALGAAVVAGTAVAAPAQAGLAAMSVETNAGYGSTSGSTNPAVYGAGCAYRLSIIVDEPGKVDTALKVTSKNLATGREVTIHQARPTTTKVRPVWRPTTPGRYVLTARIGETERSRQVTVGTGVQLPPFIRDGACLVSPIY